MLLLASNSPRRQHLLSLCGYQFSVFPVEVDENVHKGEQPQEYVLRIAESKAREVSKLLAPIESQKIIIIAADTCVVDRLSLPSEAAGITASERELDSSKQPFKILGKPATPDEAMLVLRELRGRTHQVFSAIVLLHHQSGRISRDVCLTEVPMRNYLDEEIVKYVNSGDPFDKAGGYAIQHAGFHPVQNLQGCFANVMGLPLCHLKRLLEKNMIRSQIAIDRICQKELDYLCPIHERVLNGEFSLIEN